MGMIDIIDLKKSYIVAGKPVMVLKWIDLHIEKWDFLAIMWPSWSGKTTLMNVLGLLDEPTSGKYIFDNVNITKLSSDKQADFRRDKIGFVFQLYNLLPRIPAWQQVALPLFYKWRWYEKRYAKAASVLKSLWMEDHLHHTPDMLSWWEQQRVSIARALVSEASVILADEPTWALDSKTGKDLMELLCSINKKGVTVIVVTHDKNVASYADKIIHLCDGLLCNGKK